MTIVIIDSIIDIIIIVCYWNDNYYYWLVLQWADIMTLVLLTVIVSNDIVIIGID